MRKPRREEAPSSCRSHLLGTRSSSLPAWSPTGLQPERSPLFRLPHVHLPPEISFCMSSLLAMLHAGHPPQGTSVLASCFTDFRYTAAEVQIEVMNLSKPSAVDYGLEPLNHGMKLLILSIVCLASSTSSSTGAVVPDVGHWWPADHGHEEL